MTRALEGPARTRVRPLPMLDIGQTAARRHESTTSSLEKLGRSGGSYLTQLADAALEHGYLSSSNEGTSPPSSVGESIRTPITPSEHSLDLSKMSVSNLLVNNQSFVANGFRPTLPSLHTALSGLYTSTDGEIHVAQSLPSSYASYGHHPSPYDNVPYVHRAYKAPIFAPNEKSDFPVMRHRSRSLHDRDESSVIQSLTNGGVSTVRTHVKRVQKERSLRDHEQLATDSQPRLTLELETPVKLKKSNKKYEEEQCHFIMYHQNDLDHDWPEIKVIYNAHWPEDPKSIDGLNANYYRILLIPRLTPEGDFIWQLERNEDNDPIIKDGKYVLVTPPRLVMKKVKKRPYKQGYPDGKRWADYMNFISLCPRKALEYDWVQPKHKEIAEKILRSRNGKDLPGSIFTQRCPGQTADNRPWQERVRDLAPPSTDEKREVKDRLNEWREEHNMVPFSLDTNSKQADEEMKIPDVAPGCSSLEMPVGGLKSFNGFEIPHPAMFPPCGILPPSGLVKKSSYTGKSGRKASTSGRAAARKRMPASKEDFMSDLQVRRKTEDDEADKHHLVDEPCTPVHLRYSISPSMKRDVAIDDDQLKQGHFTNCISNLSTPRNKPSQDAKIDADGDSSMLDAEVYELVKHEDVKPLYPPMHVRRWT